MNTKISLESFIESCDNMVIAQEGIFKTNITATDKELADALIDHIIQRRIAAVSDSNILKQVEEDSTNYDNSITYKRFSKDGITVIGNYENGKLVCIDYVILKHKDLPSVRSVKLPTIQRMIDKANRKNKNKDN